MLARARGPVDELRAGASHDLSSAGFEPGLAPVLPEAIRACLFDLDGVLTQTARVHAAAWKQMFDTFLLDWARRTGEPFRPFAVPADYAAYVDGKLRQDSVRAFFASRGIIRPECSSNELPSMETIHDLGELLTR